jgi:hypothetical protein
MFMKWKMNQRRTESPALVCGEGAICEVEYKIARYNNEVLVNRCLDYSSHHDFILSSHSVAGNLLFLIINF